MGGLGVGNACAKGRMGVIEASWWLCGKASDPAQRYLVLKIWDSSGETLFRCSADPGAGRSTLAVRSVWGDPCIY